MAEAAGDSIPVSGINRIDGLVQGSSWESSPGFVAHSLTYSLNINDDGNTPPNPDVLGGTWSAAWIAAASAAFTAWSNVANITFQQQPVDNSQYYFQSTADMALTRSGDDLLSGSGGHTRPSPATGAARAMPRRVGGPPR